MAAFSIARSRGVAGAVAGWALVLSSSGCSSEGEEVASTVQELSESSECSIAVVSNSGALIDRSVLRNVNAKTPKASALKCAVACVDSAKRLWPVPGEHLRCSVDQKVLADVVTKESSTCGGRAFSKATAIAGKGRVGKRLWREAFADQFAKCRGVTGRTRSAFRAAMAGSLGDIIQLPTIVRRGAEYSPWESSSDHLASAAEGMNGSRGSTYTDRAREAAARNMNGSFNKTIERMARGDLGVDLVDLAIASDDAMGGYIGMLRDLPPSDFYGAMSELENSGAVRKEALDVLRDEYDQFGPRDLADAYRSLQLEVRRDTDAFLQNPENKDLVTMSVGDVVNELNQAARATANEM